MWGSLHATLLSTTRTLHSNKYPPHTHTHTPPARLAFVSAWGGVQPGTSALPCPPRRPQTGITGERRGDQGCQAGLPCGHATSFLAAERPLVVTWGVFGDSVRTGNVLGSKVKGVRQGLPRDRPAHPRPGGTGSTWTGVRVEGRRRGRPLLSREWCYQPMVQLGPEAAKGGVTRPLTPEQPLCLHPTGTTSSPSLCPPGRAILRGGTGDLRQGQGTSWRACRLGQPSGHRGCQAPLPARPDPGPELSPAPPARRTGAWTEGGRGG